MTLFDWVNEVKTKKRKWDTFSDADKKTFSPYMIHRFLSMNQNYVELVNDFQKYWTLEPREVYKWYCDVLPRGKRFNRYIKSKKDKKYSTELIDVLTKHFECSKLQSKEYLEFLEKDELRNLLTMYGTEKRKIERIIK